MTIIFDCLTLHVALNYTAIELAYFQIDITHRTNESFVLFINLNYTA